MGSDDFHKRQQSRAKTKKRVERKAVLIAFEDSKSSKYYFADLLRDKKLNGHVVLVDKDKGQDPKRVIEKLKEYKDNHPKVTFEYEWIVIDKDDWSPDKFNGTIEKARQIGICVAFSNDSYELWILLHFELITRHTHRSELNSKLNTIFIERFGIEYSKASQDIYRLIVGYQQQAIDNAKVLVAKHIRDHGVLKPYENNPLTMIFQLVECLNSIYVAKKNCDCFPTVH